MKSRTTLTSLLAAALLGAVGLISTPRLYGGGGDDGVDILPFDGGGGGGTRGGSHGNNDPFKSGNANPQLGFVAVHGNGRVTVQPGTWLMPGLVTGPHRVGDLYLGPPGSAPGHTSLDVVAEGNRVISAISQQSLLHLGGRFELEDFDPADGESLELYGRLGAPATLGVFGGKRSTHEGKILPSFSRIDWFSAQALSPGHVDLIALREALDADLKGTGEDIGVALVSSTPYGSRVVFVAFNVDDARAVYDVEAPVH